MTLKALLELPLKLIHKTEKRRGISCFRGSPKHSYGMLDQVLVDTLGRCLNGLGNQPELRQEIVTVIRKGTPLLAGLAYGSQFLNSREAIRQSFRDMEAMLREEFADCEQLRLNLVDEEPSDKSNEVLAQAQ